MTVPLNWEDPNRLALFTNVLPVASSAPSKYSGTSFQSSTVMKTRLKSYSLDRKIHVRDGNWKVES